MKPILYSDLQKMRTVEDNAMNSPGHSCGGAAMHTHLPGLFKPKKNEVTRGEER